VLPYILRRFVNLIPVFIGATLLTFLIIQAAPGDFLDAKRLDPRTTPATIARLERQFGLDKPFFVQYGLWLKNFATGNLGVSFQSNVPVWDLIAPKIFNSLILVFGSTILLYMIAIPIGIYGAVRQYSLGDKTISIFSYFFLGFPSFFFGLLLIFGILQLNWAFNAKLLPVGGMTSEYYDSLSPIGKVANIFWHILAPMIAILLRNIANESRGFRAQMLEYLNQDFVRTARAKGLSQRVVIYKHTFRNAVTPFVANIGGLLPAIIGGAGLIEVVFNWPGLTPVFLDALTSQDNYVNLSIGGVTLVLLVIGNLISDFLLGVVDPRIRYY
jgi:peptide/nickel transport system permease protein